MSTSARTRSSWLLGAGLIAAVIFGPGLVQLGMLSVREHRLDRALAVVTARNQALTREHARLQSDPAYVEGLIRSTFKVAQPGEFVILPEDRASRARAR